MESTSAIQVGILTVSDSCFNKTAHDKSGNNIETLIISKSLFNSEVAIRHCVSDDSEKIQSVLKDWCDSKCLDLILTIGGTGFTERDVTPEATKAIIDKEAPGMTIAMIQGSLKITPFAMLSRSVCGIRKNTLIINFPGSKKASQECFELLVPAIPHAIDQIKGRKQDIAKTHQILQNSSCCHKSKVDISYVAKRARQSIYPLIPVQDAQKLIIEKSNYMDEENINFKDSLGYVLAENIFAVDNLPPFPASIKDGYAVLASDGIGKRLVTGDVTAGNKPDICALTSGNCIRISTGAPVPNGADAVVQVEDTQLIKQTDDGKIELEIEILKLPKIGQDIRPVGSDIKKGELILAKQTKLGPTELGILAAIGPINITVYKKPIISVLSTGNEIIEPSSDSLNEGKIRDSNKITLLTLFRTEGFSAIDEGIAKDNPEEIKSKLDKMFQNSDVIVTTGGVSMGEKDILKQILIEDFDAKIHFGRVFMKPGKPTTFAIVYYYGKKKLVFGLPGNPVSAVVTSHLFVLPAIRKMSGSPNPFPTVIKVKLSASVKLDPRPEYHRAYLTYQPNSNLPLAISTGNQISSRLPSMHRASVLLIFPPSSESQTILKGGDEVNALVIDRI